MNINFKLCIAPNQGETIEGGACGSGVEPVISNKPLICITMLSWHAICLKKVSRRRPGLDAGYECVDAVQISVYTGLRFVCHAWEIVMDVANRATRIITLDMSLAAGRRAVSSPQGWPARPEVV